MKTTTITLIFALFLLGLTPVKGVSLSEPLDAEIPPRGIISGTITEEGTLDPMEFTTIAVYSVADSTLVNGTISDQEGKFQIEKIPDGEYFLETNYVGYDKQIIEAISVAPGQRKIDLGLVEMAVNAQSLEEVEIVGDRKHVDYRLDKKVISVSQDINAAGGTAVDVLENTPSVAVDIEGNVSLRGSSSFTVLIDGKPSVLTGSDALRSIPAGSIENIEIITNPSAKYDPDGNAGIINLVMKKKHESGTTGIVNGSIGVNNKYRADFLLNRKQNRWNLFLGGNYGNNLRAGSLIREQVTFTDSVNNYLDANGLFNFKFAGSQLKAGASYDISDKSTISLDEVASPLVAVNTVVPCETLVL
jgi:hypothetical protein